MTLALSLAKKKIYVTIIEKNKKSKLLNINDFRTSAISQGSSRILSDLNVWDKLENKAQQINSIIVKDVKRIDLIQIQFRKGFRFYTKQYKRVYLQRGNKIKFIEFIPNVNIIQIKNNEHEVKLNR